MNFFKVLEIIFSSSSGWALFVYSLSLELGKQADMFGISTTFTPPPDTHHRKPSHPLLHFDRLVSLNSLSQHQRQRRQQVVSAFTTTTTTGCLKTYGDILNIQLNLIKFLPQQSTFVKSNVFVIFIHNCFLQNKERD